MACHPDLVLRSKSNGNTFLGSDELGEATVCRLCNDIAEDAIKAKCHHIFDRECMRQYLSTVGDISVRYDWSASTQSERHLIPYSLNALFATSP
jgi:hypothetical protein